MGRYAALRRSKRTVRLAASCVMKILGHSHSLISFCRAGSRVYDEGNVSRLRQAYSKDLKVDLFSCNRIG